MGQAYKKQFDAVIWEYDDAAFQAWCTGNTGVPIVDAGMRQLNSMGWLHNRARMIVAMYLTKHLMQDWRKGERYFMQKLMVDRLDTLMNGRLIRFQDGDFAANNGGWQWVASVRWCLLLVTQH